jgi:GNAT superfamily N-acetyltransferase
MAEHPRPAGFTFHHDTVSPGEHYFYAIDADGREAGHAHAIEQAAAGARHILIKRLYVQPNDRQKGIGSSLLDDVAVLFHGRELRLKPYPIEDAELDEDQLREFYGNRGFDDFEPQSDDDWQWDAREHMTRLDPADPPARSARQVQYPQLDFPRVNPLAPGPGRAARASGHPAAGANAAQSGQVPRP